MDKTFSLFCNQGASRFYFADIGRHVGSSYHGKSSGMFPFDPDEDIKFDICLFWDYLNLMSDDTFEQFALELMPRITEDTLIYGFLANSRRLPMLFRRYALVEPDVFEILDSNQYTARYPKSRHDLMQVFSDLKFLNVMRYPDNRQEILATLG